MADCNACALVVVDEELVKDVVRLPVPVALVDVAALPEDCRLDSRLLLA